MEKLPDGAVIQGRIVRVRDLGGIIFIQLSCDRQPIALICEQKIADSVEFNKVKQVREGDYCSFIGISSPSEDELRIVRVCTHIKKDQDALWPDEQIDVLRAYSYLLTLLREYSVSNGYTEVRLPSVHYGQNKDHAFFLDYFQQPARLTSSNALFLNIYATQLSKAFSLQKCFRAEPSHTNRHLAEFDLFEAAMMNYDLNGCMVELENLIKLIVNAFSNSEFAHLLRIDTALILNAAFPVVEYRHLQEKYHLSNQGLGKYDRKIASDLPTFIINFPRSIASWIAKPLDDQYALSFNLLVPEVGELAEGNVKQTKRELLTKKFELAKFETQLGWYTQMMPYSDFTLSGFGVGVERFLMWILGLQNIRQIHPIYRDSRFSEISQTEKRGS